MISIKLKAYVAAIATYLVGNVDIAKVNFQIQKIVGALFAAILVWAAKNKATIPLPLAKKDSDGGDKGFAGNDVLWTIVALLIIIALLFYVIPKFS